MHRPARPLALRPRVLLALALASAGCVTTAAEPELSTAESDCGACVSPPIVDWVRGGPDPEELFPRDVHHLHVLLTPADDRSFLAWGVGGGEALWLYRVQMGDQSNILGAIAGATMAHHDAALGAFFSVAGATKGDPPRPPGPPGQPPFPSEFVQVVVESGGEHEQLVEQTFEQLSGI